MANAGSLKIVPEHFSTTLFVRCMVVGLSFPILIGLGCKPKYTDAEILSMAKLRCEAISLKNARFLLADSLRFAEVDTLANKEKILKMEEEADLLKTRSLIVADSIQTALKLLFESQLTTKDLKDEYLKKVDALIATMNCK